jgi:tetratricopeptide (TPR) repeat protein
MKPCEKMEEKIYLFCDGLLEEEEKGAVEAHLAVCAHCRKTLEEARASLRALVPAAVKQGALSEEEQESIVEAQLRRAALRLPAAAVPASRNFFWRYALAAALCLAVLGGFCTSDFFKEQVLGRVAGHWAKAHRHPSSVPAPGKTPVPGKAPDQPADLSTGVPLPKTAAAIHPGGSAQAVMQAYDSTSIRSLIRQGRYGEAEKNILEHLKVSDAGRDIAYSDLAHCYARWGQNAKALDAYEEALKYVRDPELKEAYLHDVNALLCLRIKDYTTAGKLVREYLAGYPAGRWREAETYYLINILVARQAYDEVRPMIEKYLSDFPGSCHKRELKRLQARLNRLSGAGMR